MRARSDKEYYARCKRALIVAEWIDGVPSSDIEGRYTVNPFSPVGHGDIRGFADGSRFLLEAVMRIASIVLQIGMDGEANITFFKRLELGIPADALPLIELGVALNRGEILRLWHRGIRTRDDVAAVGREELEALMGALGRRLFEAATVEIPAAV